MTFTQPMNLSTFPIQSFQTISFEDTAVTIDKFQVTYNIVSNTTYTITLVPIGIVFMRKTPVIVKTP